MKKFTMKTELEQLLESLLGSQTAVSGRLWYHTDIVTAKVMELYTDNKRLREENEYLKKIINNFIENKE